MLLTMNHWENVTRFISVLLIFLFVLAITYFATRYIANVQRGKTFEKNTSVIETVRLSQTKYIQIVRVGTRYLAIAVCKDTVTMLAELREDELDLEAVQNAELPGFADLLEKAKEKLPKKK